MGRKKGEIITLHCARCSWSTELPLSEAAESRIVPCKHCAAEIYWHRCPGCGLCYVGEAQPRCAVCDGNEDAEDLAFD